ncbi:MAG: hypothetical protein PWR01_445 [Clostridiales bacterium]|jgi:hypothetical protein|uniref:TusA-related sulfurtransferase n=1 Tax=Caldicoprobacter faecalis TaxID=937334 RepID=A0A1I5YQL7_9FIRM|nr:MULTISPECIES: hypothetical protein [Caldicoprobacter]MCM8900841.1 hypothetical protein [Caldicoprobacter algeriensis]MDN5276480.1 hypothetical protein [Clostridiales bacterium]SFQ46529.1 hypothetical protein SAMN05444406_1581 [Caldicoprobacter faecalis]
MANIMINLGLAIQEKDLRRLRESLQKMSPNDEITIRLESAYSYEEDIIINELERLGMDYRSYGGKGNDFYVIVRRRLH